MVFQKGHLTWNKGKKFPPRSKETKERISKALKQKENSPNRFQIGNKPWNFGIPPSEETRHKIGLSSKGRKMSKKNIEILRKLAKLRTGYLNHNWKGGRRKVSGGYIKIWKPNHPFCDISGYVMEHRLVMERQLKRHIMPGEIVHHINEITDDNRIENLYLFENCGKHMQYHKKLIKLRNSRF